MLKVGQYLKGCWLKEFPCQKYSKYSKTKAKERKGGGEPELRENKIKMGHEIKQSVLKNYNTNAEEKMFSSTGHQKNSN